MKNLRWWVIGLIALATVINYIDRQSLSVLWPSIAEELYPDYTADERKEVFAFISVIFIFSYAFGQAIFGRIFDWIGTRLGFALSIGVWSLATAAHALATGLASFSFFRSVLGIAEAGNWPGAAKGNAEWFPTKERAFAQGLFNSGAAIGGIVAIPVISYLAAFYSWQVIFIMVGLAGLLWLLPWMVLVKAPPKLHPWITEEEREYILTGQQNQDIDNDGEFDEGYNPSMGKLLSHKESWGVIIASAVIDPIWWLFVVWIPIYLFEAYGISTEEIKNFGWIPYVGAMLGAWFGGLLAQNRIKAGKTVTYTRKLVITLGCLIMLPSLLGLSNPDSFFQPWNALVDLTGITALSVPGGPLAASLIMAIVLFGFQTAIGNVQTLPSDFYGGKTVGTLAGISGTAAKLTGAALTAFVPWLTTGGNYTPVFVLGAVMASVAIASIWILCPRVEPLTPKNS